MGGSLGLAIKALGEPPWITGWDVASDACGLALQRGACDAIARSAADAVKEADLVIVATPVGAIEALFKAGVVVSDVASTKAQVISWAKACMPGVSFVGAHPMAGSERQGMAFARADLLKGATYCLTPDSHTPAEATAALKALIRQLGAIPLTLEAAAHDVQVAMVSHLPFVLSALLVNQAALQPEWPTMRLLAAGGFRDATRMASGDALMHRDICLTNQAPLRDSLLALAQTLLKTADKLADADYLNTMFLDAKAQRDAWVRDSEPR
jgi:prephenate dehydrogenase